MPLEWSQSACSVSSMTLNIPNIFGQTTNTKNQLFSMKITSTYQESNEYRSQTVTFSMKKKFCLKIMLKQQKTKIINSAIRKWEHKNKT